MAFRTNLRDLEFVIFEQLDLARLTGTERYAEASEDLIRMILSEADKFAHGVLAPLNKSGDEVGAVFQDGAVTMPPGFRGAWEKIAESGWLGLVGGPAFGGQGLPITLKVAVDDLFFAACTGLWLTGGLASAAAGVIEHYGSDESKGQFLEKMYSGRWGASMCLTEPGAGSALGSIRSRAEKIDGSTDRYLISGEKIFITMGEHDLTENIVHLVLAKVPGAPAGTRGISLFIVPKFKVNPDGSLGGHNDVRCTRIEHKMGIRASATCQLAFGDGGHCEGIRIGEENKGLMYMFRMMNEERIDVGIQGLALASAAYLYALDYSRERIQSPHWSRLKVKDAPDVAIVEHPDIRRSLMWQKSNVEGMRALLFATAYYTDLSYSLADDAERALYNGFVELLTPVCKSFCSDRGFECTVEAIQCLGGYGYTSEYDAEQYCRDAKIASIYEGTNAIQANDFVTRKLGLAGGAVFASFMDVVAAGTDRARAVTDLAPLADAVDRAREQFLITVRAMGSFGDRDSFRPLLHARNVLDMMGYLCAGYFLLDQARIASEKLTVLESESGAGNAEARAAFRSDNDAARYYFGKTRTAAFYITQVLPTLYAKAEAVASDDASPMDEVF